MEVIPANLLEATASGDDLSRSEAVQALARFGPGAVPYLIDCLGSDSDLIRDEAISGLRNLGPAAAPAITALVTILQGKHGRERIDAADALAAVGPAASEAVPMLMECLEGDTDDEDRRWLQLRAANAIWRIARQPEKLIAVAVELFNDEEFWLRADAAELLGHLGGEGIEALPALKKALAEEIRKPAPDDVWRESVRSTIQQAIRKIEDA